MQEAYDSGFSRAIDPLGRIVLPKELRDEFDIKVRDRFHISVDRSNGTIFLTPAIKKCLRCGSQVDLIELKENHYLCRACLENLHSSIR